MSVESPHPQPSQQSDRTEEWVHIPTPGDHYSPRTGSAIITVIHEMCRWHAAVGGKSRALVARGTWDGFADGCREEIVFPRLGTPPPWHKAFDRALGAVGGRRLLSGRAYAAAADHLGRAFDGVIFIHNEPSAVEQVSKRCPNARVCLWVQNQLFAFYADRQVRRVIGVAHRVICCSDFIRRRVVARVGEDPKLVAVLNGVDTERFVPPPSRSPRRPPEILFVGRVVPEKGVHLLIGAAAAMAGRGVNFHVRIVGSRNFDSGDSLTAYQRELFESAAPLQRHVTFEPFRPREAIVGVYQSADVLCVPSDWDDPCPLTVFEGLACGLVVVASRRGGIPEEGGCAALYFDPPDHEALAEALTRAIRSAASADARRASRARSLEHDWSNVYKTVSRLV